MPVRRSAATPVGDLDSVRRAVRGFPALDKASSSAIVDLIIASQGQFVIRTSDSASRYDAAPCQSRAFFRDNQLALERAELKHAWFEIAPFDGSPSQPSAP
jgi:hypothetical protein